MFAWRKPSLGCLGVVVAAGLLAGCGGGGNVGMRVRKPASQRPDVDLAMASKGKLVIPGGGAFNLTSFKSGQMGAARGLSEAIGNDGARCRAEARDGGSAWGEYQLGYCFDNVTDVPLDVALDAVLNVNGYGYIQTHNIYRIVPLSQIGGDEVETVRGRISEGLQH